MFYQGVWLGTVILFTLTSAFPQAEYHPSSRCSDATCRAAPRGKWCEPQYTDNKDGGCCPEWHCDDGSSVYGVRMTSTYPDNRLSSNWKPSWSNQNSGSSNSFLDREWDNFDKKWDQDSLFSQDSRNSNQNSLFDRFWGRRR